MGGAAIIFKRPARLKDLVGGTAMLVVKRPPRSPRTTEIARNNPRRPPRPGETPATPGTSDADKAEAYKDQGNTYYDVGQFDKAVEAYQTALKYAPKDPVLYNNLGAAYFSQGKNN